VLAWLLGGLGALLGGGVAARVGAPATVIIGGALTLAAVALFLRARPAVTRAVAASLAARGAAA